VSPVCTDTPRQRRSNKIFMGAPADGGFFFLQRSVQDLAGLYGCEPTLAAIEQYRQSAGLATISEKCFDAANIEFVLLDDGLTMDKMVSMGWHRKYIPGVHRVLRIETVAEAILNQVQGWPGIASESPC
jgi:hypothetical protein